MRGMCYYYGIRTSIHIYIYTAPARISTPLIVSRSLANYFWIKYICSFSTDGRTMMSSLSLLAWQRTTFHLASLLLQLCQCNWKFRGCLGLWGVHNDKSCRLGGCYAKANKVVLKYTSSDSAQTTLTVYVPYGDSVHTFRTEVAIVSSGSPRQVYCAVSYRCSISELLPQL